MVEDETTFEASLPRPTLITRRAFVAVLEGARSTTIPLTKDTAFTIGRSRSSDVHVDDGAVSRLQATLTWDGQRGVFVEDHRSRNGTFVGDVRVEGRVRVPEGATIRVGPAELVVMLPKEPTFAAARAPASSRAFVAEDPAMGAVVEVLARAATKDVTVLLLGETGSGKEVMARFVHDASPRAKGPFVAVNCGSLPESLAESTLFGHEKGAFTGAAARHAGVFEQAQKGTLFLDEIGELSPASQARLLRVLEERRVTRLGATSQIAVDVRLVAATHRDLTREVQAGRFREDLLYRLDVVRVRIPTLRERPDDVLPLAQHFLTSFAEGHALSFGLDALEALRTASFPGNVRQLRNVVQRGVALATTDVITAENLGLVPGLAPIGAGAPGDHDLQKQIEGSEYEAIMAALAACDGNQTHAAKRLGIARRTLINKLEKYGLKPSPDRNR
jgi:two-component system, NtrC family, response regulator AtoC